MLVQTPLDQSPYLLYNKLIRNIQYRSIYNKKGFESKINIFFKIKLYLQLKIQVVSSNDELSKMRKSNPIHWIIYFNKLYILLFLSFVFEQIKCTSFPNNHFNWLYDTFNNVIFNFWVILTWNINIQSF